MPITWSNLQLLCGKTAIDGREGRVFEAMNINRDVCDAGVPFYQTEHSPLSRPSSIQHGGVLLCLMVATREEVSLKE